MARTQVPSDAMPASIGTRASELGMDVGRSRQIAPDLYLVPRRINGSDLLCYYSTRAAGGGCQRAGEFFGGEPVVFGVGEQGTPDRPESVVIAGVAQPEVSRVRALFGDVRYSVEVTPTEDGGFIIEASAEALAAGTPRALQPLDSNGEILKEYEIPDG